MSRGPVQRIQDSVHGLMEFRGLETVVIDVLRTPEVQRLRRIRQLGLAYLVFPGAEHSRMAHSLGVAHLGIRFGRRLQEAAAEHLAEALIPGDSAIRDLAVAGLCHDLGHGPMSHAWEREIVGEDYDAQAWSRALGLPSENDELAGLKWHELVTQSLLAWKDGRLHKILESHEAGFTTRLRHLLRGNYYLPYLPVLLQGDMDIDRADFVVRDTHQCGVAYGRYDLDWLVSTCMVCSLGDELVVGFDEQKAVRAAEQFLIARRALYETVYHHRAVRSAEGMVALLLRRLRAVLRDDPQRLSSIGSFVRPMIRVISGEALAPHELLAVDDFTLWVLIEAVASMSEMDETAMDLAERIRSRDLFKQVPCSPQRVSEFLRRPDSYARMYEAIRPFCPGRPEFYIVVDEVKFEMLSENSSGCSYFARETAGGLPPLASHIREHPDLRQYRSRSETTVRLFTIREAVEPLRKRIG